LDQNIRFLLFLIALIFNDLSLAQVPINPTRIEATLSKIDVAHHWLAGKHVDWLSGNPDGKPVGKHGHHTHCSAFVAAVCRDLGVPMLEPPQHPQELLADAQYDWLTSKAGRDARWKPVEDAVVANEKATEGKLVLAVYHTPDETQPGHIAIVIPSKRTPDQISTDGPDVTEAGLNNYVLTDLRTGFKNHPSAWQTAREVRFFVYAK